MKVTKNFTLLFGVSIMIQTGAFGDAAIPCADQVTKLLNSQEVISDPHTQSAGRYEFSREGMYSGKNRDRYLNQLKAAKSATGVNVDNPPDLLHINGDKILTDKFTGEKVEKTAVLTGAKDTWKLTFGAHKKVRLKSRADDINKRWVKLTHYHYLSVDVVRDPVAKECYVMGFKVLPKMPVSRMACFDIAIAASAKNATEGSITKAAKAAIPGKFSDDEYATAMNHCRGNATILKLLKPFPTPASPKGTGGSEGEARKGTG